MQKMSLHSGEGMEGTWNCYAERLKITFRYAHLFPSQQTSMADSLSAVMTAGDRQDSFSQPSKVIQLKAR